MDVGDEKGEWTYARRKGNSVLDYIVGDEEVWEKVVRMKVEDRIDLDHFPVVGWIKEKREKRRERGREREGGTRGRR